VPRSKVYTQARKIVEFLLRKKAQDVCLMDLRAVTDVADYFVVCHGDSDIHVKAIADAVLEGMENDGVRVWHKEGYPFYHWVLLDYVDVVVHIFQKTEREFYGLERLWGDAKTISFQGET
jgi:ribosome-associated protein